MALLFDDREELLACLLYFIHKYLSKPRLETAHSAREGGQVSG